MWPDMPMSMWHWHFWWSGLPTSVPPDWSSRGQRKSTATATNCLIQRRVAIEGKYPLAAVLLRRALIDVTLRKARATRYKHAARHVREIDSLELAN